MLEKGVLQDAHCNLRETAETIFQTRSKDGVKEMKTKTLATLALFSVISLVIFTAESMIGPIVPIPGVKLGLANIITLIVITLYGPKEALAVLLVRIILGSILGGQMVSFFYSVFGGMLCLAVMSLTSWLFNRHFLVLTSMCGAAAHNIGQIAAAILITQSLGVIAYLPVLIVSGIITGCFTGFAAKFSVQYLRKLKFI